MKQLSKLILTILIISILSQTALASSFDAKTISSGRVYSSARVSKRSKKIAGGTRLTVLTARKGWAKVRVKGRTAYIKCSNLKPAEGSRKENIAALALLQLGKSYGNNEPSSFNCSSLVKYCFEKYGIDMRSSAKDISKDSSLKTISSRSALRVGDIICFNSDSSNSCDHVAISLGGNSFVEASQSAGRVQVNHFDSWYRDHFMFAKRA